MMLKPLEIELKDTEWPFEGTNHDRQIVRGIVFDNDKNFYFVKIHRNDIFANATLIETSGGGVENGENLEDAIVRELGEELGANIEIVCKLGVVSDYYNLIKRHNINNYYLCRVKSFGEKHMTDDEINWFHLETLKVTYQEAVAEYESCKHCKLGRLLARRELPILHRAQEILDTVL